MKHLSLSFATKLFLAFVVSNVVIIFMMTVLIGFSMRSGFAKYLLEAEIGRFSHLRSQLQSHYAEHLGWQEFEQDPRSWHQLVRQSVEASSLVKRPPPRPPRRLAGSSPEPHGPASHSHPKRGVRPDLGEGGRHGPFAERFPPPPRASDPLRIGRRLALVTAEDRVIVGHLEKNRLTVREAIFALEKDETGALVETDQVIGWLVLSSLQNQSLANDNLFLIDQFRNLLLVSLFALGLSALAAFLLARGVSLPVRDLVQGTRKLADGEYKTRLRWQRGDEIGLLADHFDALAASLEVAEQAERQWISDASHELKTPLAVLRVRIEGIQDGIYPADRATLEELLGSVARLSMLVSDLNALSHAREGRLLGRVDDEALDEILREALAEAEPRLKEKGLVLHCQVAQDVVVSCDRLRVRQLFDNLLENSRRYTDRPGAVYVFLDEEADGARLVLEDTAPHPPEDSVARLFDRFYRAESSRARQLGGSGLGLAICRAIVVAHGGTIQASVADRGGLAIEISLPRVAREQSHV